MSRDDLGNFMAFPRVWWPVALAPDVRLIPGGPVWTLTKSF